MKNSIRIVGAILSVVLILIGQRGNLPPLPIPLPIPHVVIEEPLIAGEGLHVLIVEEVDDRRSLSREQLDVIASSTLRGWFTDHHAQWHLWDKDHPTEHEAANWQAAMKIPRQSLPWLIVSLKGKPNFSSPLPANLDATLDVLKKYAP